MTDNTGRQYKINIDPRILELLGPSLYTNIYFVLAELVANSYDANASNVYIIQKENSIIVEDDGTGMSYNAGDIEKYLNVAIETRTNDKESYTVDGSRKKIGRKGVGKLAALAVSENVLVMTVKNRDKSGFVLSRHVGKNHELRALSDVEIKFEEIVDQGTSIVMTNPQYGMHKTTDAVKNNLLKIFPLVNEKFKIHLLRGGEKITIDSFDNEIVKALGALITFGDEFECLAKVFDSKLAEKGEIEKKLLKTENSVHFPVRLKNKAGEEKDYDLEIKGWIGAYRTTRDRKKDPGDFPDNFISLLSNSKLGEYNILPLVGKNRLPEVYIVGQLHIDLFEETELHDMALSNRQGYKTDDPRYQTVIDYVRDNLLPRIVAMREMYADHQKKIRDKDRNDQKKRDEEELRKRVDEYRSSASKNASKKIAGILGKDTPKDVEEVISAEMNNAFPLMGLKQRVDSNKKKILISHYSGDKALCDVIEKMLVFNNVPEEDIIYTSSDNVDSGIPAGAHLFEYLRDYFVDSYSDKKIFVIYVTSENMAKEWNPVTEVGAGWITESKHQIFTINDYRPLRPLDIDLLWHKSNKKGDHISMSTRQFDEFIKKILYICTEIGFSVKDKTSNKEELRRYVKVV